MIEIERNNSSRKLYLPNINQNVVTNEISDMSSTVSNKRK